MTEARLVGSYPVTSTIVLTRFKVQQPYTFQAGQHTKLGFTTPLGATHERPFSMASSPRGDEVEFIVELKKNSPAGEFFSTVKEGSVVQLSPPQGLLTVSTIDTPLHFIAAGMGLAPFRSICQDLFLRGYNAHIRLTHLREPGSWGRIDEELAGWHKARQNFSYSLVHTSIDQASQKDWQWRHVSLGDPSVGEITYLCGSPLFVERLSAEMRSRGFTTEQIVTGG